jgi:hypothetical protein
MSDRRIERLISVASAPLSLEPVCLPRLDASWADGRLAELAALLGRRNGFYCFESALLVLPAQRAVDHPGLLEWNAADGWRSLYSEVPASVIFFAQDLFAGQFGVSPDYVSRLDPESGALSRYAETLEEWAGKILDDFDAETGWPVARDWQKQYGPLQRGHRLLPRLPFILGGDYVAENLVSLPATEAMMKLGQLYQQVRGVPDGTPLTVRGWLKEV